MPFVRDSTLWPVTFAAVAIFVVLGASGLLLVFVERNLFAAIALLVAFWISVDVAIRERRRRGFGPASGIVAGFWSLSTIAAIAVRQLGWF